MLENKCTSLVCSPSEENYEQLYYKKDCTRVKIKTYTITAPQRDMYVIQGKLPLNIKNYLKI
jgi:hypothetical protein